MSLISPTTKVTYPPTPDLRYVISRIRYYPPEESGAIQNIDITRVGYGHVFNGTVEEAETEGFVFHVEREVTMEEVNEMLGIEPLPLSDLPERIATLEGTIQEQQGVISNLQHELSRANERVEKFRAQVQAVIDGRNETLHQWAVRTVAAEKIRRVDANELLNEFGIENVPGKYSGDAVFLDGSRLEAIVFEADDEDDWEYKVRDALEVGSVRVRYDVTITDADTTRRVDVDNGNSDYSPDVDDSWVRFEDIAEVE